ATGGATHTSENRQPSVGPAGQDRGRGEDARLRTVLPRRALTGRPVRRLGRHGGHVDDDLLPTVVSGGHAEARRRAVPAVRGGRTPSRWPRKRSWSAAPPARARASMRAGTGRTGAVYAYLTAPARPSSHPCRGMSTRRSAWPTCGISPLRWPGAGRCSTSTPT